MDTTPINKEVLSPCLLNLSASENVVVEDLTYDTINLRNLLLELPVL